MARRLAIVGVLVVALVLGGASLIRLAEGGATRFDVDGTTLTMSGPITGASAERLQVLLEETPGLERVVLGDMPGTDDVTWLIQMGVLIRQAGLETRAEGMLVNDAILLFAAGESRVMGAGELAFLSDGAVRAAGAPLDRNPVAETERGSFLERMLGDGTLAEFGTGMRESRDRYTLTEADKRRFGLLSGE